MNDSVKVSVVRYPDREHLVLRWRDPLTGKPRCKTSGTSKRRDAERLAATLEREILDGQQGPAARMSWDDFREYHDAHCLSAKRPKTRDSYDCALNVYERFSKPDRLTDVTTGRVTAWQTQLRTEGKSEATIGNYTRHLKAVLRWAHSQGLLAVLPKLTAPKRTKVAKVMKGRPITPEEFDRMLAVVPKVVLPKVAGKHLATDDPRARAIVSSWEHYLRGLWWSGLRLRESLVLEWNADTPGALIVDFSGRRPMLRIPAESDKGGQDRLLPMAPEFARLLEETPPEKRVGRVFKLHGTRYADARMKGDWVSRVVSAIGKAARVVVDQRERRLLKDDRRRKAKPKPAPGPAELAQSAQDSDGIKRKYASAHDLRRAFGLRWSSRVMPPVLQQLMRHEDIETTMRYYVGRDAEAVADALWAAADSAAASAAGTNSGNNGRDDGRRVTQKMPQSFGSSRLRKHSPEDSNL
jgi:integrase